MKTETPNIYRCRYSARNDCALCNNHSARMAQSIARSAVSQAAHDRLETGRSIADRTDLQKHERLYALAMLRTVFPEMELKPGERSLLLVVGKNAQMRGGSISKPVKYFFRRISA